MPWSPSNHQDVVDRINALSGDVGDRITSYDVQAQTSPLVNTEIEGLTIAQDPTLWPFQVHFSIPWQMNTGTAASGTVQEVQVFLSDYTSLTDVIYQEQQAHAQAGAITNRQENGTLYHNKWFPPTTTRRVFRMLARQAIATPAGWSQNILLAENAPVGGWTLGPMCIWIEGK